MTKLRSEETSSTTSTPPGVCESLPDDHNEDIHGEEVSEILSNNKCFQSVLLTSTRIEEKVGQMAHSIHDDYVRRGVTGVSLVCVLKGAFNFFSDLSDALTRLSHASNHKITYKVEFVKIKSYTNTSSVGNEIQIQNLDVDQLLDNVLIIEDLVDTGRTLATFVKKLRQEMSESRPDLIVKDDNIKVACFLRKRTPLSNGFMPHHLGFNVADKFVVGYGMDYNEYFRTLKYVACISEFGIQKYKM